MTARAGGGASVLIGPPTVESALRGAGLGPILDTPVPAVLRALGLPSLPALPPAPPLPGLPPLPVLDPAVLLKPLTDLLGVFGSGDLAGAGDPGAIFKGLSSLLDLTISGTTTALKEMDKVWAGAAATGAATKMARTSAETGAVSAQGAKMSADITVGAGMVAGGLAALQAVIAKTVGLLAAALPFVATPPGQAAVLAIISAGLAEGGAVVAATKAQLLAPTASMAANGKPVPVSGAPAGAGSAFAIAASVLEAAAGPIKAATGALGSALTAAAKAAPKQAATPPGKRLATAKDRGGDCRCPAQDDGRPGDRHHQGVAGAGRAGQGGKGAGGKGATAKGLGGAGAGLGAGGPREVTASYAARTPVLGGTEPAGFAATTSPSPAGATPTTGTGMAPVGAAGALGGAHAVARLAGGAPLAALKSSDAVSDCARAYAPAVFGDDRGPDGAPDEPAPPEKSTAGARLAALREELLS